jgi:hypothetical protein
MFPSIIIVPHSILVYFRVFIFSSMILLRQIDFILILLFQFHIFLLVQKETIVDVSTAVP